MIMMIVMILMTEGAFLTHPAIKGYSYIWTKWMACAEIFDERFSSIEPNEKRYSLKRLEKWKWLTSISQGYYSKRCLLQYHFHWKWLFNRSVAGAGTWVLSMWHKGGIYIRPNCTFHLALKNTQKWLATCHKWHLFCWSQTLQRIEQASQLNWIGSGQLDNGFATPSACHRFYNLAS